MKHKVYKIVLLFLPLLQMALFGYAQNRGSQLKVYDFSPLQTKIQSWVDSGYYNGASIIIVKDNKVLYKKFFGTYTPETIAFIASAGKWLAAATIAVLVDEGKLQWNDPVKKYLPQFTDAKGEATLAQLLSHTAGYPDYQPADKPTDMYQTLEESVAQIVSLPADTLPGTSFKYGGLAMNVAGRMAEIATGKVWETIFQEKIAIPLRMKATRFTPVDSSGGHTPMLGGGARSTLQDFANFLSMITNEGMFEGKKILSEKCIDFMQADQVQNAFVVKDDLVQKIHAVIRNDIYGLGEWREEVSANGEATLISSPSWAGTYPWVDKKNKVYGFYLAHIVKNGKTFNSFLASPKLATMTRNILNLKPTQQ